MQAFILSGPFISSLDHIEFSLVELLLLLLLVLLIVVVLIVLIAEVESKDRYENDLDNDDDPMDKGDRDG